MKTKPQTADKVSGCSQSGAELAPSYTLTNKYSKRVKSREAQSSSPAVAWIDNTAGIESGCSQRSAWGSLPTTAYGW